VIADAAEWRRAHEEFFGGEGVAEFLGVTPVIGDGTLVVTERFRLALAGPARVRGLLLLAHGVPDYPWPPDDPYSRQFDQLYAAGDRDGIAELGLRTWAAAGAGQAAQAQVRGAAEAFFRVGDFERADPPAYGRLGQIRAPATVVVGDREYPMVARCAADIAARIPGCRQVTAPGADHLLPLRVPAMIADLVGNLAARTGTTRAPSMDV
jgi:pimeloyl-ACP methyl ester carboxylesterase